MVRLDKHSKRKSSAGRELCAFLAFHTPLHIIQHPKIRLNQCLAKIYLPSHPQFFGISGILFCVLLSSPPVHVGTSWWGDGAAQGSSTPSLCALLARSTHRMARQPGKPCKGEGATEAPLQLSCCTSQKMQTRSVRQRRKSRDWQLRCCVKTCQPADGWCPALCRDWGPVGEGKRGDSSVFPWLAKGV